MTEKAITGKELYWQLSRAYSSEHNDLPNEMNRAQVELQLALDDGLSPELCMKKMKHLLAKIGRDNEYKTKISTVILNRFWDKEFLEMIPSRIYKGE